MERNLYSAKTVSCAVGGKTVTYTDQYGNSSATFTCNDTATPGNVASGSAKLTTNDIDVEYVRAYKSGDGTNGEIAHSYTVANTTAPFITLLNPSSQYPDTDITVTGVGFGTSGTIHFGTGKSFTDTDSEVTQWTDTKIVVQVPHYACGKFGANPSISRDVWVTSGSVDSDTHSLTILKPTSC